MDIEIFNIGGYVVKNYLINTPQGVIAIDTGYPGDEDKFIQRFTKKWSLDRLKYIFLTHHHDDHAGFLAALLEKCDAKVILHHGAIEHLKNGKNYESLEGGYSSFPGSLFGRVKKEFCFPSIYLGDRAIALHSEYEQVFEDMGLPFHIVFLPGHTADHIGLFLPHTRQLFCGDAAMNAIISVARHTIWIDNVSEFEKSWDKMIALDPLHIYPSHGTPFLPRDLVKHRHYMDHRKLIRL